MQPQPTVDHEEAVRRRYSGGAKTCEKELCCAVDYDPRLLEALPEEVVERDYGCGDPTRHLRPGERVLDLGSGSGKACFLASQIVGPEGSVVGVDMNDDMLALARRAAPVVAERVGYANVEFRKARIQDLRLDCEALDARLAAEPVGSHADLLKLEAFARDLRERRPAVPDRSVDVVVSNCVLNLVRPEDKRRLFEELFRVLAVGGRAVISDIVSDEDVPERLTRDPELWSGCVSGAFREDRFLEAFEEAGFHGITVDRRADAPWQTIDGIELRSITVVAYRGKDGDCLDQGHAVVYRGPFREVRDDDGHVIRRGVRTAVCGKTFRLFGREPYRDHFDLVPPRQEVPEDEAPTFACSGGSRRWDPRETKGACSSLTTGPAGACGPSGGNGSSDDGCC